MQHGRRHVIVRPGRHVYLQKEMSGAIDDAQLRDELPRLLLASPLKFNFVFLDVGPQTLTYDALHGCCTSQAVDIMVMIERKQLDLRIFLGVLKKPSLVLYASFAVSQRMAGFVIFRPLSLLRCRIYAAVDAFLNQICRHRIPRTFMQCKRHD